MQKWLLLFLIAIVLETAMLVYFNLNRWRRLLKKDTNLDIDQVETSGEFSWKASHYRAITMLGIIGVFAVCIIIALLLARNPSTIRDLTLTCVVSIYAFIVGLITKSYFKVTESGLIRVHLKKRKTEAEQVFTWDELLRIEPHNHGFKYFLKDDDLHQTENKSKKRNLKGFIPVGEKATEVIAIITSRGIAIGQPAVNEDV